MIGGFREFGSWLSGASDDYPFDVEKFQKAVQRGIEDAPTLIPTAISAMGLMALAWSAAYGHLDSSAAHYFRTLTPYGIGSGVGYGLARVGRGLVRRYGANEDSS